MPKTSLSRRRFVQASATAAFGFQFVPSRVFGANERVHVASVGVGGKGASDVGGVSGAGAAIVGLCDIDVTRLGQMGEKHTGAEQFKDYREMYDKLGDTFDAVTVSTPDHMHFHAAYEAIKRGKHVYVQKPMTHSIWEARTLTEAAAEHKVITQMGNQAHAGEPIRRAVELIRAGVVGKVKEVHAWTNRPIWPQGIKDRLPKQEIPANVDWDQWIGPAPMRDYNAGYVPFKWRGWWDFGTGALGDMGCHIMDMPFWALGLKHPTSVEARQEGNTVESGPNKSEVSYTFPAGEWSSELTFKWYDGGFMPADSVFEGTSVAGNTSMAKKFDLIVIGEKGKFLFNRSSTKWQTAPANLLEGLEPDQDVPRVKNEDQEWIDGIKEGGDPLSGFAYSGPFTETVLLGNLAVRLGKKLDWDGENLQATNAPEAAPLIKREYRKGWEV